MTRSGDDAFSQLLYPMLSEQPAVTEHVLGSLAVAPLEKSSESNRLRRELIDAQGGEILACAEAIAEALRQGGKVLACGNGGSATEAADLAAELLSPPPPWPPLPALCLTNDVAVVTAIANDVSFDDIFLRQVIAFGRPGDVVVAFSTSGNSENLIRALHEARRRGLATVGIAGYDGGRMSGDAELDHCFVVGSSSIHRIQEVQTTLHHLLIELIHLHLEESPCA